MENTTRFDPPKDELKELYQNYTLQEMADLYGVSQELVRRRVHEHGIPARKTGPSRSFKPEKSELERLYQTMSMAQIAEHYGVGETVVFKRLKENGITLKGFESGGHRKKTGRVFTDAHKGNLSDSLTGRMAGEQNPRWKGGTTEENLRLRRTGAYIKWKKASLERAGHKCEECGALHGAICECCGTKVNLHVHHMQSFAKFPALRFDPTNSEVLCPKCHRTRHK
jgi:excisionase family DNA binding protein